jgi:hypothetical protein
MMSLAPAPRVWPISSWSCGTPRMVRSGTRGRNLGMHKASEEELVLVLEGAAGHGRRGGCRAQTGTAVVIPAMVPHDLENVGDGVLRAIGFFSGASVISTFEPTHSRSAGLRGFTNVQSTIWRFKRYPCPLDERG